MRRACGLGDGQLGSWRLIMVQTGVVRLGQGPGCGTQAISNWLGRKFG